MLLEELSQEDNIRRLLKRNPDLIARSSVPCGVGHAITWGLLSDPIGIGNRRPVSKMRNTYRVAARTEH